MEDNIPEINLNLKTIVVEAKTRPLRDDIDYLIGMKKKEIDEKLEEIRMELKFHNFKMEEVEEDEDYGRIVNIYNIKENIYIGVYIVDFINLEIDEAVELLTTMASLENLTETEVEEYTDEEMKEIMKALRDAEVELGEDEEGESEKDNS